MRHIIPRLIALTLVVAACSPAEKMDTASGAGSTARARGPELAFAGDFRGPLGVQLYSVRDSTAVDVPRTLARVRAMGFQEVELAGTYGLSPTRFRDELSRAGLRATSMHASYERMRDSIDAVLDEAKLLGVSYVGVAWIPHPRGQPFTVETARRTAADFNRWGRAARERGLKFFYHTHGYEFRPMPDGVIPFDVLMAETNPQDVMYEMDVFWVAHPGVDPATLLRKYPDRWKLMHIKDMRKGLPTPDYSGGAPREADVPVGTGQIDYPSVLRAAREIGLDRYYIEDENVDPFVSIPQSVAYLQRVTF